MACSTNMWYPVFQIFPNLNTRGIQSFGDGLLNKHVVSSVSDMAWQINTWHQCFGQYLISKHVVSIVSDNTWLFRTWPGTVCHLPEDGITRHLLAITRSLPRTLLDLDYQRVTHNTRYMVGRKYWQIYNCDFLKKYNMNLKRLNNLYFTHCLYLSNRLNWM